MHGDADVYGNAEVYDGALVGGNARVYGDAKVYGEALVCGNDEVYGEALVFGNARVYGYAKVYGEALVCGNAEVYGNAEVCGNADVRMNGDYIVFKNWWSSGRYFTWTRSNNMWKVGCFHGTGKQLTERARKDGPLTYREYKRVVNYVETILEDERNDNIQ